METLVELSKIAALLSASALCIYLIVVLIRLKAVLETFQHEIVELNKYLKPLLENLTIVSDKMRAIASKIDDQVNMVNGVFAAFRRITDNVVRFDLSLAREASEDSQLYRRRIHLTGFFHRRETVVKNYSKRIYYRQNSQHCAYRSWRIGEDDADRIVIVCFRDRSPDGTR